MKLNDFTTALESKYITSKVLNEEKDLSKVSGSMTNILYTNREALNSCKTKEELFNTIKELFKDNNIDTEASRRLLLKINLSKSFTSALEAVWNSILKGSGEGTIKLKR